MQERHDRRKAELHASGRDVQFDVGSVGNRGSLKLLRNIATTEASCQAIDARAAAAVYCVQFPRSHSNGNIATTERPLMPGRPLPCTVYNSPGATAVPVVELKVST